MKPIQFSDVPTVERTGIIFRAGNYGTRGDYSAADVQAMAGDEPLPINIGHAPSLLDGRLGWLGSRWATRDATGATVLFGKWFEPEPLALLLGEGERKVSIEINLRTKRPVGLALTHEPYIADAAMFSRAVNDAYVKFSRGESVTPLDAHAHTNATVERTLKAIYRRDEAVDWAEVNRARVECGLSPR